MRRRASRAVGRPRCTGLCAALITLLAAAPRRAADLLHRTPEIAAFRAATLLRMLADLLAGEAPRGLGVPPLGPRARLVVPAGDDTTLANLSGALGLGWSLPGQPDPTPPGAALAFELWRNTETGARTVRVRIYAQTLDQLRSARVLGPLDPPVTLPLAIGICRAREGACGVETFATNLCAAVPPVCVR